MRFLADSQNYYDWLRGIDKLTQDQKEVLYERLKSELSASVRKTSDTADLKAESTVVTREISRIRETADKPASPVECCLHCGSTRIKKHGKTKGGVTRYICKDCKKTFSENHGLITHYSHLDKWQWLEVIHGIVLHLSITDIAKNIGTSTSTAWSCRLKVYQSIKNIYGYSDTFNSIVEVDGKYERLSFKGCKDKNFFIDTIKRMPRHHRSRKQRMEYLDSCNKYRELFENNPSLLKEMIYHSQKRMDGARTIDKNHQHICILTAVDRNNNIYIEPVTSGTADSIDVYNRLQGKISKESVLVTDDHHSYKYFVRKERIEHVKITGGTYINGAYSLSRVNALHSAMDKFISKDLESKPATKYLDLYLMMFWWLQKNKDLNQTQLTDLLYQIMTGHVDYSTRAKMEPITICDL
ncbi:MAG: hypothetical protein NC225_12960, partial [Clostridium sp.]|nr:hypothetical protein [Clostridium sp.]